jgi:hypothetical protein
VSGNDLTVYIRWPAAAVPPVVIEARVRTLHHAGHAGGPPIRATFPFPALIVEECSEDPACHGGPAAGRQAKHSDRVTDRSVSCWERQQRKQPVTTTYLGR